MDNSPSAPAAAEWRPLQDAATGDYFWYNTVTGECSWEVPEGVDPEAVKHAEWPWEQYFDENSQRPFWHNPLTNVSTWKNPEWVKAIDDTQGIPYWYNIRTNVSTWEHPSDYISSASESGSVAEGEGHDTDQFYDDDSTPTAHSSDTYQDLQYAPGTRRKDSRSRSTSGAGSYQQQRTEHSSPLQTHSRTYGTASPTDMQQQSDVISTPSNQSQFAQQGAKTSSPQRKKIIVNPRTAAVTKKKVGQMVRINSSICSDDLSGGEDEEELSKEQTTTPRTEEAATRNGGRKSNSPESSGVPNTASSAYEQAEAYLDRQTGFSIIRDEKLKSKSIVQCFRSPKLPQNFRMFWDASPQEHSLVMQCVTMVNVSPGSEITYPGNLIESVILPVEGTIAIEDANKSSYDLSFGEIIHDEALISHEYFKSQIRATAKTRSQVLFLSINSVKHTFGDKWLLLRRKFLLECSHSLTMLFLRSVNFFQRLHEDKLKSIANTFRVVTRYSRESLLIEDTPGDAFFILVHGEVRFTEHGRKLKTGRSGEYFGEISLFKEVPVSASVSATQECLLLVQHRRHFSALLNGTPGLRASLQDYIASHAASSIRGLQVEVLANLSEDVLSDLSKYGRFAQHASNSVLVRSGTYDGNCYVITQGTIKMTQTGPSGKLVTKKYASGDCINYEVLASSKPRAVGFDLETTMSGATTIAFRRQDIKEVFAQKEELLHVFELTILGEDAPVYKLVKHQDFRDAFKSHSSKTTDTIDLLYRFGTELETLLECFWDRIASKNTLSLVSGSSTKLLESLTSAQMDDTLRNELLNFKESYLFAGSKLAPFVSVKTIYALTNAVQHFLEAGNDIDARQHGNETRFRANETSLSSRLFEDLFEEFLQGTELNLEVDDFRQSAMFRRFLRNNTKHLNKSSSPEPMKQRLWYSPRFNVLKQNRVGKWQSRELCFNINSRELLVYKSEVLSFAKNLLDIEYMQRVAEMGHRVLRVCFRNPTNERVVSLKFDTESARENFCLLAHLLQSDMVFMDDVFKEDLGGEAVSFKVQIHTYGMASARRVLTIDPQQQVLKRQKDFNDAKQVEEYSLSKGNVRIETSCNELERLKLFFKDSVKPVIRNASSTSPTHTAEEETENIDDRFFLDIEFPTASLRSTFRGLLHAVMNKLDFSSVRAYGIVNAAPPPDSLRIWCGTFNCGGSKPTYDTHVLSEWIPPQEYDLYAVALQECDHKDDWLKSIRGVLQASSSPRNAEATEDYVTVAQITLWGIHLFLYARNVVAKNLGNISVDTVATGVANVLGNKGAVAVGFTYRDSTSFAFVSAHLAARHERLAERNQDYATIIQSLNIGARGYPRKGQSCSVGYIPLIHSYDHIFFMGDLNYRVDLGKPGTPGEFEKVKKWAESKHYGPLVKSDQLRQQMRLGYFSGFSEPEIQFPPTYRLERGKGVSFQNKKNQNASYTDRVLYRSSPSSTRKVRNTEYRASKEVNLSDHRPVLASFEVECERPFYYVPRTTKLRNRGSITVTLQHALLVDKVLSSEQLWASLVGLGSNVARADSGSSTMRSLVPAGESVQLVFTAPYLPTIESSQPRNYNTYPDASRRLVKWFEEDLPDLQPIALDPDWLGQQDLLVTLQSRRGQVLGYGEIPLLSSFLFLVAPPPPSTEITLSVILAHPFLLNAFRVHLEHEHALENLQFYQAIEHYKREAILAASKGNLGWMISMMEDILQTYVLKDSPCMVNLSSTVYRKLMEDVETLRAESPLDDNANVPDSCSGYIQMFNDSQSEIFLLLQRDNFPRFLKAFRKGEEEREANGGGAPFACRFASDGVSVGALLGQIRMDSFDILWDREERLRALQRLIERKHEPYAGRVEASSDSGDDTLGTTLRQENSELLTGEDLEMMSDEDDKVMAELMNGER
eukprot:gb/GECG01013069.1/.p1 GENE.gb/GECG01013069.1/~~gb/GECG01013069.1/.p1  ORF type:complete len:1900 (+),score=251.56 gb/GECG01013069.1/:1-5700(+)